MCLASCEAAGYIHVQSYSKQHIITEWTTFETSMTTIVITSNKTKDFILIKANLLALRKTKNMLSIDLFLVFPFFMQYSAKVETKSWFEKPEKLRNKTHANSSIHVAMKFCDRLKLVWSCRKKLPYWWSCGFSNCAAQITYGKLVSIFTVRADLVAFQNRFSCVLK